MSYALILMTSLLFALQTLAMKKLRAPAMADQLRLNAVFMGLGALLLCGYGMLFQRDVFIIGRTTAAFGVLFGFLYAADVLCYLLALGRGPVALTAFFLSASMLIPALFGIAFLGERLTLKKGAGILMLVCAMFLAQQKEQKAIGARSWIALCLLAFLFNGFLSVCQKEQQTLTRGTEGFGLMLIGYACASLFSALSAAIAGGKRRPTGIAGLIRRNAPWLAAIAVCSMLGNLLLTFLASSVDSVLLYPLSQGGLLVLLALASVLIYRERGGRRAFGGLVLGIAAMILIA
ncbi:MAG TPA: EamA family transporter [Candidatus Limiplasma sp.]|nr:EamA family transporter [Candidatus Limiplasma sp.]